MFRKEFVFDVSMYAYKAQAYIETDLSLTNVATSSIFTTANERISIDSILHFRVVKVCLAAYLQVLSYCV